MITADNILEKIKNVIIEFSPLDSTNISIVGRTKLFEELNISSINFVMVIAAIEDEFDITIDLEDIDYSKLNTVNSLVELVCKSQK